MRVAILVADGFEEVELIDEAVVVDNNVLTSRKPDDIPAFNREVINLFAEARERASRAA